MTNTTTATKRWRTVTTVFAVLISCLALFAIAVILNDYNRADAVEEAVALIWTAASALLWISVYKARTDADSAGTYAIIAGILTLPVGAILILTGVRMRAAVTDGFENWLETNRRGQLGIGS